MELTEVFVLLVDDVLGGGGDCLYLEDSEGFVVVLFYDGAENGEMNEVLGG